MIFLIGKIGFKKEVEIVFMVVRFFYFFLCYNVGLNKDVFVKFFNESVYVEEKIVV